MNIKGDYPITYHISDNFSQVTSILDFICPSLLLYVSNTFYTFYYNYVILANYLYFGNFRYIQYSNACARAVRNSLKPELKVDAMKRGNSIIKATRWEEGKPVQGKYSSAQYIEYCRFHILREYFIPLSHNLLQNVTIENHKSKIFIIV